MSVYGRSILRRGDVGPGKRDGGRGTNRRCAAGAARSSKRRGKSEDRAMTKVDLRYSPRVSRYLRRR